jgi:hypothetical protein
VGTPFLLPDLVLSIIRIFQEIPADIGDDDRPHINPLRKSIRRQSRASTDMAPNKPTDGKAP